MSPKSCQLDSFLRGSVAIPRSKGRASATSARWMRSKWRKFALMRWCWHWRLGNTASSRRRNSRDQASARTQSRAGSGAGGCGAATVASSRRAAGDSAHGRDGSRGRMRRGGAAEPPPSRGAVGHAPPARKGPARHRQPPRDARTQRHPDRSLEPPPRDITRKHGIPLTSPARTLLDLAVTLPQRELDRAVEEAEVQRRVSLHSLNEQFGRTVAPRHRGTRQSDPHRPRVHPPRSGAANARVDPRVKARRTRP